ncbi:MMPL family transporter [Svornostia abyssi]|uniref:MMPL family transporter n=1 Tax=Svornostia abyssi TaxID=2898438 RepID=A0ABY5PG10_9ACTN|nr:MMPL family transporter [Parviterribacteraceae bacterium J379]
MRLILLAAGRRSKFLILAVAVAFASALASQAGNLASIVNDDPLESLPAASESREAALLGEEFQGSGTVPAIVIATRDGGLTAADRRALDQVAADLRRDPPPLAEGASRPQTSQDGAAALIAVPLKDPGDEEEVSAAVEELRERLTPLSAEDGLQVAVTGGAAFTADLNGVFEGLDGLLLAVTGTLVLVLLILIYRSPVFWLIPFVTVLFAEGASRGAGYLLGSAGLTVTGQSSGILSVLVFGATTDYALLLVSRYREELRAHADAHHAMRAALRGTAPAILASGGTVVLGLLTLLIADVGSTQAIGPLGAAGVAIAMVLSLTILPVTLILAGRRAFWPLIPRVGDPSPGSTSRWARLGERISRHPRRTWLGAAAVLGVMALGTLGLDTTLTQQDQFTTEVEAVEGQQLISERFQPGITGPADVIVRSEGRADAVREALLERRDLVLSVARAEEGPPGARLSVVLASDPYDAEAVGAVPDLRAIVREADPRAVVGGPSAEAYDLRDAAERDNVVVPPLALLVVLVVLVALLRALVAPLVLLATVVLSFAASLGVATVAWDVIFGFPAADPTLPLLAFVFLVALGVDYNIFLAERAREESARHGTRRGVLLALATTGGVITAAGVVLAGTFSVLAVLPLVVLTQIGTVVAFGVLLDTTLVRSVLVPAAFVDLGARTWWPSRLAREDGKART